MTSSSQISIQSGYHEGGGRTRLPGKAGGESSVSLEIKLLVFLLGKVECLVRHEDGEWPPLG